MYPTECNGDHELDRFSTASPTMAYERKPDGLCRIPTYGCKGYVFASTCCSCLRPKASCCTRSGGTLFLVQTTVVSTRASEPSLLPIRLARYDTQDWIPADHASVLKYKAGAKDVARVVHVPVSAKLAAAVLYFRLIYPAHRNTVRIVEATWLSKKHDTCDSMLWQAQIASKMLQWRF